jgi:hypothetical protein
MKIVQCNWTILNMQSVLKKVIYIAFLKKIKPSSIITKKSLFLAPIKVKILVAQGLGNKIITESGTKFPENAQIFLLQKINNKTLFKKP